MIKAIVLKWKTVACLVFVLAWIDANAQCDLTITNPPCQAAGPVNLTAASITAGTANLGTLTYWTNSSATAPLANPNAVNVSGVYWIKNTVGSCTSVKPVIVTIGTTAPTGSTNLFPSCAHSATTPNAIFFDWYNNIGETGYTYSYSVNGGPPVTASTGPSPSSHVVSGLVPGDRVEFWVSWTGVCTPPLHTIAYPESNPVFNLTNGQHICQGTALPATDVNGIVGTWNHPIVSSANGSPGNYQFTPNGCASPIAFQLYADAPVTPTFNPIAPICVGSAAPALPAASTNTPAIPGTWNPPTINTAAAGTQVFTFTPNAGQCATTATLSVTVSNSATPTFNAYPARMCDSMP